MIYFYLWRRGRDSNPRGSYPPTRFPSVLLRPLGHLSNPRLSEGDQTCLNPGKNCYREMTLHTENGGSEIRTRVKISPQLVFETSAFNRSAIPPLFYGRTTRLPGVN